MHACADLVGLAGQHQLGGSSASRNGMPPVIILWATRMRGAKLARAGDPAAAHAGRDRSSTGRRQGRCVRAQVRRAGGGCIGQQCAVDDRPRSARHCTCARSRRSPARRSDGMIASVGFCSDGIRKTIFGCCCAQRARNPRGSRPCSSTADQHAAPADQVGAAGDQRIGELLEGDLSPGAVIAAMTAMTAACAPSVGTMVCGSGVQLPRPASARRPPPAVGQSRV